MPNDKCRLCRKQSKGLCADCRAWKEMRNRINKCPCDICYEVEKFIIWGKMI